MLSVFSLGLISCIAILWWLLNRREQRIAARGNPRLSNIRLVLAAIGMLAVLFSGGCGALFAFDLASRGGHDQYVSFELIAVLSLPVVAVGLLIWWLAMRRPRKAPAQQPVDDKPAAGG